MSVYKFAPLYLLIGALLYIIVYTLVHHELPRLK